MRKGYWIVLGVVFLSAACEDDARSNGASADAGGDSASPPDATLDLFPLPDTGSPDAGVPDGSPDADNGEVVEPSPACGGQLLAIRSGGGLTEDGVARAEMTVRGDRYVWLDDQTPETPVDGVLDADDFDALLEILEAIDADALEDGYGVCCAEHSDGTDVYLRFPGAADPDREVRVSELGAAPEALQQLISWFHAASSELAERGARAPLVAMRELPESAGGGCDAGLSFGYVTFHLEGPDDAYISAHRIEIGGEDVTYDVPLDVVVEGRVVAAEAGVSVDLETDEGEAWRLVFDTYPSVLPPFALSPGHRVTLRVRIAWAFGLNIHGLVIEDERGVLFVADEGLAGVASLIEGLDVEVSSGGCPQVFEEFACGESGERALSVSDTIDSVRIHAGDWTRAVPSEGYALAILNLKSYASGYCDDYWNYAYAGFAMTGSDYCGE